MRSVAKEKAAFVQRFPHQPDVASLQVAHTAVDELGTARTRGSGEVARGDQDGAIPAGGTVERRTQPGGASPDDQNVIRLVELGEGPGAVRGGLLLDQSPCSLHDV